MTIGITPLISPNRLKYQLQCINCNVNCSQSKHALPKVDLTASGDKKQDGDDVERRDFTMQKVGARIIGSDFAAP